MLMKLIRHGDAYPLIPGKKLQGSRLEELLSPLGAQQMRCTAKKLRTDEAVVDIGSSPILRAWLSALILGDRKRLHLRVMAMPELQEINLGQLNNKTWDELEEATGIKNFRKKFRQGLFDMRPFDGESVVDVDRRLEQIITDAERVAIGPGECKIRVTHGGLINRVYVKYGRFAKQPRPEKIEHGSIHVFEF